MSNIRDETRANIAERRDSLLVQTGGLGFVRCWVCCGEVDIKDLTSIRESSGGPRFLICPECEKTTKPRGQTKGTKQPDDPQWETITDDDDQMIRVRWSEPDKAGGHLYVQHYPATPWGCNAANRAAERLNAEKQCPWEYRAWRLAHQTPTGP